MKRSQCRTANLICSREKHSISQSTRYRRHRSKEEVGQWLQVVRLGFIRDARGHRPGRSCKALHGVLLATYWPSSKWRRWEGLDLDGMAIVVGVEWLHMKKPRREAAIGNVDGNKRISREVVTQ